MPYILKEIRKGLTPKVPAPSFAGNPGELNYQITMLLNEYLSHHGLSYTHLNDCMGALMGAMMELYRRVAVPYENTKLAQTGDVYDHRNTG